MTVHNLAERRMGQEAIDQDKAADDDQQFWSVTTLIGVMDKPALIWWSADQTARAAIDNADLLSDRIRVEGEEEVYQWLRRARFRSPRGQLSAADLGTSFHESANRYALSGVRPDPEEIAAIVQTQPSAPRAAAAVRSEAAVVGVFLDRFDEWLQRFSPSYQAAEVVVYHTGYGYAGQADAFLTVAGQRFIVDYKTSREPRDSKGNPKTPYPEQVGLQLAAYRWAEFAAVWRPRRTEYFRRRYYLLSPLERDMAVPVPEVDGGLCFQVTTESCEAFPIRCDEEVWRSFLHTTELFRWVNQTSKVAMGPPLEVPS